VSALVFVGAFAVGLLCGAGLHAWAVRPVLARARGAGRRYRRRMDLLRLRESPRAARVRRPELAVTLDGSETIEGILAKCRHEVH
jgi:hypothetical protein